MEFRGSCIARCVAELVNRSNKASGIKSGRVHFPDAALMSGFRTDFLPLLGIAEQKSILCGRGHTKPGPDRDYAH